MFSFFSAILEGKYTKGIIMLYNEAMQFIEESNLRGSVLGLDGVRTLAERVGNPQDSLRFIHIAGTNGKGSTLAYISTVLHQSGYKVGRYLSPTIFEYRERFQINEKKISQKDFCGYIEIMKNVIEDMQKEGISAPTVFEIETVLSFLYFKDKGCDLVVLETGLGGDQDATNIIKTTLIAVFTSISMDHMNELGDTITKIAEKKAGIIKQGCTVVTVPQDPEVIKILRNKSQEEQCSFVIADSSQVTNLKYGLEKQKFSYHKTKNLEIMLSGMFQIGNAVLAVETLQQLTLLGHPIKENHLRKGMLETKWQGRFSIISKKPYFIVDGAHNADAAQKLAETIRFYFTNKRIIYIMGILKDKEYEKIVQETYFFATHIITVTPPHNARGLAAYELALTVKKYHNSVTVADSLEEAVEMAYLLADKDTVVIAFGSLSYLGELITIVENRQTIRRDTHGK